MSSSQPPAGLSFRIQNPTPSPVSSGPPSPAAESADSSSSSSPRAQAFKVPHKPVRPSPLAAAQRNGGFVKHEDDDSSDDDQRGGRGRYQQEEEEEVGWDLDSKGKGTYISRKEVNAPLIIAPLPNKDCRNSSLATKTHKTTYLPPGAEQSRSNEPIVTIEVNDGGNIGRGGILKPVKTEDGEASSSTLAGSAPEVDEDATPKKEETLDERAIRALLAGANGGDDDGEGGKVEAIQALENKRQNTISEEDAFRRDVLERPEEPSLSDYAQVPVANFGMALLMGMGWKEGQAASRHRKGLEQAYVPAARPSLLGIGAKERAAPELGKGEKAKPKWKVKEEAKKYVPIMKVDRNGSASGSGTPTALSRPSTPSSSAPPSRRTSRSAPPSRRISRSASPPRRRRDDDDRSSSRRDDREPSSSSSSRYRERDDREPSSSSSSRRDRDDRDRYRDRERDDRDRQSSSRRDDPDNRKSSRREETEDERRERKRREKERERDGDRSHGSSSSSSSRRGDDYTGGEGGGGGGGRSSSSRR